MSTVAFHSPDSRWGLKFCSLHHADKHWLILFQLNGNGVFKAWSNDEEAPAMLPEEFALQMIQMSDEAASEYDVDGAFLHTAGRWQYWGSGIPMPIESYYDNTLASLIQQHLQRPAF